MQHRRNTIIVLLSVLACLGMSHAQGRGAAPTQGLSLGNSVQGQLTVTVTVVASVGLVTGPDGVQRLVVANGSGPLDNVSSLKPFTASPSAQVPAQSDDVDTTSRNKNRVVASDVTKRAL